MSDNIDYDELDKAVTQAIKANAPKKVASAKPAAKSSVTVKTTPNITATNYGITGSGTINGRLVFVYAQDFTVKGGSLGLAHAQKIERIINMAMKAKAPVISMLDGGGARIQEGVDALAGFGKIFQRIVDASGIVPQISLIMGPCAGGAVYAPALTDFTFMVKDTSYMFLTGPDVVKTVTHEELTKEELGGAETHTEISGVADGCYQNDIETLLQVRRLFNFLPLNNEEQAPYLQTQDDAERVDVSLNTLVPENPSQAYDIKELIYKSRTKNQEVIL